MREVFSGLVRNPLFTVVAEWIWNLDEEDADNPRSEDNLYSPALCLDHIEHWRIPKFVVESGCFTQLVTKILGIVMIVGAFFNKAPTLLNLLEAQSAEGISSMALYSEVLFFTNSSIYSILLGHPFTAYGENIILLVQTLAMVALTWRYSKTDTSNSSINTHQLTMAGLYVAYCLLIFYYLPPSQHYLLYATNDIIVVYSGSLQVAETRRVQHTGAQSVLTTGMNLAGELVRIGTTLAETGGDIHMLLSYGLCVALSATMLVQHLLYWDNTVEFYKQQQEKRQGQVDTKKKQ